MWDFFWILWHSHYIWTLIDYAKSSTFTLWRTHSFFYCKNYYPIVFQECNKHVSHGVIRIPIRKTNDFGYFLSHNKSKHVLSSDTDIMKDSFFFFYCKTVMNVSRKVIHILKKLLSHGFFKNVTNMWVMVW